MLVGVISDTHGRLAEWIAGAFEGVELIVHAGDVGSSRVLAELDLIAPVVAVRGNMDSTADVATLPDSARLEVGGVRILVVHDPSHARALLHSARADVVVVGHTHRPRVNLTGATLTVNPGSASRSVGEGCSVALLRIEGGVTNAEIVRAPTE